MAGRAPRGSPALEAQEDIELSRAWEVVERANEPAVLPRKTASEARGPAPPDVPGRVRRDRGAPHPERDRVLAIPLGSLTPTERREIESHVTHTFRFLSEIPWTGEFRRVPEIAYAHHEKLDGTGYPRRLKASDIPLQSRMMAISDIFDALVAGTGPTRRRCPWSAPSTSCAAEARRGAVDAELLRIFVASEIWKPVR